MTVIAQEVVEGFRLSPQQKRVWLLQESEQPYCVSCSVQIEGRLDRDALSRTINEVIAHHEILRTTYKRLFGMTVPLQVIDETCAIVIQDAGTNGHHPEFDFEHGPLLQARLSSNSLHLTLPALCVDTVGLRNLVREISEAYAEEVDPSLESTQYADLSEWQNELLESEDSETGLDYWKQRWETDAIASHLPLKKSKSGFSPQVLSVRVAQPKVAASEIFFMTCWLTVLSRSFEQSTLVLGTVFDCRRSEELEGTLGLFEKYLPVRCELDEGLRFDEVCRRVGETHAQISDWQEYFSWEQVSVAPERATYFPYCFEYQEPADKVTGREVSFQITDEYSCTDRFDLKLRCVERDGEVQLEFYYDGGQFQRAEIERLAQRFETVLRSVLREPEQQLGRVEVLSDEERRELLVEWNDTRREFEAKSFTDWFVARVELHAEALAVGDEEKALSFRELNERANQLGHYLRALEVGPEEKVGLCVERSVEMVVGVLGVLKAGGAYVPLEPSYPQERLSFMVADAGVRYVLTQERYRALFSDEKVVSLDGDWEEIASQSVENFESGTDDQNLAYVIYTSGSTGVPKGVMVTHGGFSNYLHWAVDCYYTRKTEGSLVHTPLSFDLTITSLFLPLLVGEPVRLLAEAPGVEQLATALRESQELGAVKVTPAHLRGLRQEFGAHYQGGKPEVMVIGGEALLAEDVQYWREQLSQTRLINEYGPTETVVGCCVYEVRGEEAGAVPIGRPISNTELYVLDSAQELMPVGVKGELYIGGAGVARGYLGRADLTAERFVPNPFSREAGARLYRTGDVARYLADGNLEYLGRADQQVKIRGYRIELGEIEAVLSTHAGVSEAIVLVSAAANGEQRLVAYVVPQNGSGSGEWREYLQERLPEYMVPSVFMSLPQLPLTTNGKVDRRALPAPEWTRTRRFVPPDTEVERVLCAIWSELLGVKEVGLDDNFFELGGDSIISIQIVVRAHQAGLRLTPRHMFAHQTVRELAAVAEVGEQLVRGEQGEVHGAVVLTPIQQWFFEEELTAQEHYNHAVLLRVPELRSEWLREAMMGLVRQHDALRLRFAPRAEVWASWIAPVADGAEQESFSSYDLASLSRDEQRRVLTATAEQLQRSLNLESGPILRVGYFDLGREEGGRLLVIIHHLAVDGVSWRILLEDLQRGYEQVSLGEAIALGPKSTSWREWGEQLQRFVADGKLAGEEEYWLAVARESTGVERRRALVGESEQVVVRLGAQETLALLQEVPSLYGTQSTAVLLWALVEALGESRLVVDVEGHGREELEGMAAVDLTRTVGWFTSLYPLALALERGSDCAAGLKQVQEQVRAVPQRGMGYGLLKYLSPSEELRRRLRERERARVSFNYLGQVDSVVRAGSMFQGASEEIGSQRSELGERSYELEVNGSVRGGELFMSWSYSSVEHERTEIEAIGERYLEALRQLLEECRAQREQRGFNTADFPLAQLDQQDLDAVIEQLVGAE